MKKFNGILWGIVLVAIGIIFGLNALGIADIDVFFKGWWTLFIIVPSLIGLFTERDKTGNVIGLIIGAGLLLAARGVFTFGTFWKLLIPAIVIVIGVRLIFGNIFKKGPKPEKEWDRVKENSGENAKGQKEFCAVFSGNNVNFDGEVFEGADLTAVFGGVECHLERAIIEHDVTINATAVFGGVDIYLPANVNVKLSSSSVFGGAEVKNHHNSIENTITVYVNASAVFGGVDVK